MKQRIHLISNLWLLLLTMAFMRCTDDNTSTNTDLSDFGKGGVFVINEGNFQSGNASLTYFNLKDKTVKADVFKDINGTVLGDLGQAISLYNNKLYLVVNNSQKIEVCDAKTLKVTMTIKDLASPRYFQPISPTKAYVTDLFANGVHVINPSTGELGKKIALKGWSEQMVQIGSTVYVTHPTSAYLYAINSDTDVVVDSIRISLGANSLCKANDGSLWVLCGGDFVTGEKGALHEIDVDQHKVLRSLSFAATDYPTKLCVNPAADSIYFLNGGLFKMGIQADALPQDPFVASGGRSFYGLAIHPVSGKICVTDAKDFTQKGDGYIYSSAGQLQHTFATGIIPGDILFEIE